MRTVCVPVGFGRVGCNAVHLRGLLREIPTLGEALGQALEVVHNGNPNECGCGCASHNCSPFKFSQLLVRQERHDLI
jgi:hypothetical protein